MYKTSTLIALLGSAVTLPSVVSAAPTAFAKRDSWGAAFSLGPAAHTIISTQTTVYPGKPPSTQEGLLAAWLGISNGTGDLIQSIIGSYPLGKSECGDDYTLSTWCISSEVYGNTDAGTPNQWVGEQTTAFGDYDHGIIVNYTLVDASTYLWTQTMTDATTGTLLSSFNKTSGPMLGWGTANECNDLDGVACTGTVSEQIWENSVIILQTADPDFSGTLGAGTGVTHTDMETSDGGKTWTISKITIPPMISDSSSSGNSTDTNSDSTSLPSSAFSAPEETSVPTLSSTPSQATESSEPLSQSYAEPSSFPSSVPSSQPVSDTPVSFSPVSSVDNGISATDSGFPQSTGFPGSGGHRHGGHGWYGPF